jgi:arsenate reductase
MAAALFNKTADADHARALSAGTQPAERVHPEVVAVMREIGVDLAAMLPQRLTSELAAQTQILVTMGCAEECPAVPGAQRHDWPLPDPRGRPLQEVRAIRDAIRERVVDLVKQLEEQRADRP